MATVCAEYNPALRRTVSNLEEFELTPFGDHQFRRVASEARFNCELAMPVITKDTIMKLQAYRRLMATNLIPKDLAQLSKAESSVNKRLQTRLPKKLSNPSYSEKTRQEFLTTIKNLNREEYCGPAISPNAEPVTETPTCETAVQYTKQSCTPASIAIFAFLCVITIVGFPEMLVDQVGYSQVLYYGWLTAVFTGLGIVPFLFVTDLSAYWKGISNGVAAGMMLAASYSLIVEGSSVQELVPYDVSPLVRVACGGVAGISFIVLVQRFLEGHEEFEFGDLAGASAQRMLLIVLVMFVHSMAEGIGIGVSFGGAQGGIMGKFISLSLAMHNVPEGLAVALVFVPKGQSRLKTALWAVFTSIPQPIMSVPAFMFVERFTTVLPVGLGFAAGAMGYVAVFELIAEAVEDINSKRVAAGVVATSFAVMFAAQEMLKSSL